jgi:hypothetical protein
VHGLPIPAFWQSPVRTASLGYWIGKLVELPSMGIYADLLIRHGKMVLEFPSNQQPRIEALSWDKDNDSLAILTVII